VVGIGVCIYLYFRTKHYLRQYADETEMSLDNIQPQETQIPQVREDEPSKPLTSGTTIPE